jgi:hypothetical protein
MPPRARGRGRGRAGAAPSGGGRGRGRGRTGGGVAEGQSRGQFLQTHTGPQAGAIANAEAGAEYNPEIRELRTQAKGSRKREGDLGQWYAQLAADYQGASDAGAAALQSIQDTTGKQLAEAGDRSSADLTKLSADNEAFAKLTGGPIDTAGLSKIAQAGAAAQRSRVALNVPVAEEQAHFVGKLGGEKVASRMKGIEARQEERDRREKIRKDLTGVRKEKGLKRTVKKEEIREADRGYASELKKLKLARQEARTAKEAAAAEAALAQVEAARQASNDAIAQRQAQERIGISAKNARTSARSQKATAKNYEKDNKGGMTQAERRDRKEHYGDAYNAAKGLLGIKVPKSSKEWAKFQAALIEKLGSSYSQEAIAAVAKLRQAQAAKNRGAYDKRVRKGEVAGPPSPKK